MIKVTLIGTGNVSWHLENIFSKTVGVQLLEVLSSRGAAISNYLKARQNFAKNDQPDLYIIAVSDDAIRSVSRQLKNSEKLIVHTSGSVSMDILPDENRRGIFYPLQTFSKEREIDFQSVPICIEAQEVNDERLLKELAATITKSIYEVTSAQRKSLHLAAVFVNNFTNHIYQIGNELCNQNEVPFAILKPLISETVRKIESLPPFEAQTGPARRNDRKTIEAQLAQLENKNHKEIYKAITESILKTYEEEL